MLPLHVQLENSTLRGVIKRLHFPLDAMLVCVRWYAAYPLSLRNLEEMMAERGVWCSPRPFGAVWHCLKCPAKAGRRTPLPPPSATPSGGKGPAGRGGGAGFPA